MSTDWLGFAGARAIDDEERRAVDAVLVRKTLYRGAGLEAPTEAQHGERELASALRRRFALFVNSGTSALLCALVAAGVNEGDEVVVPSYGWVTDLSVILHRGAVPVLAPIRDDLNIDTDKLGACLTERTRAVVAVHACGSACELAALERAAGKNITLIEDACQALGAQANGHPVGRAGRLSVLSFQAFKVATGGEGGALLTDEPQLYEAALRFHDAGLTRFASGDEACASAAALPVGVGLNLRMSELTAALVRVQLRRVPSLIDRLRVSRRALISALEKALGAGALALPATAPNTEGNGAFLVLRAADERVARIFVECWAAHGCSARRAIDARLHAAPGWLEYLRREGLPHRVVDEQASQATLARALILEVNWQVTAGQLDALRRGTGEALART